MEKEKPIEELTQEEARESGRWLEWWTAVNKEVLRRQVYEHNIFEDYRPIRS